MIARYDGAAERWASGATLVYGPIAEELAARTPHPLAGRVVLDVGAGTGAGTSALRHAGASPIALDVSVDMLRWDQATRPPAVVAGVEHLPLARSSVDDVYASFVLNHVATPVATMRRLASVVRPGGGFLATTFAAPSGSTARDRIDQVTRAWGWEAPDWYRTVKVEIMPLLDSVDAMHDAATRTGLRSISVEATAVDVGIERADQLVDYRLGQAHVASWFATMDPARAAAVREASIAAVEPVMAPFRPVVIFLVATVA